MQFHWPSSVFWISGKPSWRRRWVCLRDRLLIIARFSDPTALTTHGAALSDGTAVLKDPSHPLYPVARSRITIMNLPEPVTPREAETVWNSIQNPTARPANWKKGNLIA